MATARDDRTHACDASAWRTPPDSPQPRLSPMDGALAGGNLNAVVRDGDSLLRNAGPWTPTVHRYLAYLAVAGVDWAPHPLGIEVGRERLSFVEGDVPLYPLPDWVWADAVLEDGARRLRQLHDASVGFGLDGAVWQAPAKVPAEVIC